MQGAYFGFVDNTIKHSSGKEYHLRTVPTDQLPEKFDVSQIIPIDSLSGSPEERLLTILIMLDIFTQEQLGADIDNSKYWLLSYHVGRLRSIKPDLTGIESYLNKDQQFQAEWNNALFRKWWSTNGLVGMSTAEAKHCFALQKRLLGQLKTIIDDLDTTEFSPLSSGDISELRHSLHYTQQEQEKLEKGVLNNKQQRELIIKGIGIAGAVLVWACALSVAGLMIASAFSAGTALAAAPIVVAALTIGALIYSVCSLSLLSANIFMTNHKTSKYFNKQKQGCVNTEKSDVPQATLLPTTKTKEIAPNKASTTSMVRLGIFRAASLGTYMPRDDQHPELNQLFTKDNRAVAQWAAANPRLSRRTV